jgi:hypothetical protein
MGVMLHNNMPQLMTGTQLTVNTAAVYYSSLDVSATTYCTIGKERNHIAGELRMLCYLKTSVTTSLNHN